MADAPDVLNDLTNFLAKLPGLGPRSARRIVLYLLRHRETRMHTFVQLLQDAHDGAVKCASCGNIDVHSPCAICSDKDRDRKLLCVVEHVGDLWAIERAGTYRGLYQVLGGLLSALRQRYPEDLPVAHMKERIATLGVEEIILALPPTLEGQNTLHFIRSELGNLRLTRPAYGIPMGGQLDYLDTGTLEAAFLKRQALE